MKNKRILILLTLIFISSFFQKIQAQDFTNPIAYLEVFLGPYGGNYHGFFLGSELNYQRNKSLMTLRYSSLLESEEPAIIIPTTNANTDELAILYGLRKINNSNSFSGSAGLSYNVYRSNSLNENIRTKDRFIGLALEANIKWFKYKTDSPFNIGFGFKLSGNISKKSYIGLSAVLSLGWHKIYKERIDSDDYNEDND